jgi:hypothetical protein
MRFSSHIDSTAPLENSRKKAFSNRAVASGTVTRLTSPGFELKTRPGQREEDTGMMGEVGSQK